MPSDRPVGLARMGSFLALQLRRLRLAFTVQTGARRNLLLFADVALILQGLFVALLRGGRPHDHHLFTVLMPLVIVGPLVLADLMSIEIKSGTLDLTLALDRREMVFITRAGVIAALMWLQGTLLTAVVWWTEPTPFSFLLSAADIALIALLVAGAALFWAVHTNAAGTTWLGTMVTLAALGPWVLAAPTREPSIGASIRDGWSGLGDGLLGAFAVLAGASALLLAYALRRLRRPEVLLR